MIYPIAGFVSSRLVIRQLSEIDDIDNYLSWMQNESNFYIESIDPNISKSELYDYIKEKNSNPTSLLLGIFDKATKRHIGNGKFEPIDFEQKFAVLGLFIGDARFRGKGLAVEFIHCASREILVPMKIERILLGVDKENISATNAYTKAGFKKSPLPILSLGSNSIELELRLQ